MATRNRLPKLSIGMPVYNGEKHLKKAVDTILNQTFTDFELIICDNASTDRTREMCEAYAEQDPRVLYVRNPENIGPWRNYNRTVELARGEYFAWAAADDEHAPTFFEKCVAILDRDPGVILATSNTLLIDEAGVPLQFDARDKTKRNIKDSLGNELFIQPPITVQEKHMDSHNVVERYAGCLSTYDCFEMFGVTRTQELRRTSMQDFYYGSDKVNLLELAAMGRYAEVPEPLFMNRKHPHQSAQIGSFKEREKWNNPQANSRRTSRPRLWCMWGYFKTIITPRSRMTLGERVGAFFQFVNYYVKFSKWDFFVKDTLKKRHAAASH